MKQVLFSLGRLVSPVLIAAMIATPAMAQQSLRGNPNTNQSVRVQNLNSIQSITSTIFSIVTTVAVIVFVMLLLVGGIQYLASFGNEEATTKAKKLIVDAVVGLFIVLAAAGVANFVFEQLGVSNASFFLPANTGINR